MDWMEYQDLRAVTNNRAIYPDNLNPQKKFKHQTPMVTVFSNYVNRVNTIVKIYQSIGIFVFILAIICYCGLTIILIVYIKNHKSIILTQWLFITSIILSLVVLILGVSYNQIATVHSINYLYLSVYIHC